MNKLILSGVFFLALVVGGVFYWSTGGYGEVSPDAYKVATALYGTCLSKNEARLDSVTEMLDGDHEQSLEITPTERDWLESMVRTARDGSWNSAAKSARRMMEDQIKY